MSYLPIPPRVWSRVQNPCTYIVPGSSYQETFIPLTGQTVSQEQADYENKLLYKGNILQYKGNSSRLTKQQKYTQLAKGFGPNRKKVFATQSQIYTNPNTSNLLRVNYIIIPFPNEIVGSPNNISGPYQYNIPNPDGCSTNLLQDGGTLVCGTNANPCTGEIIRQGATTATICNPASASNVPGYSLLCWNNKLQTWFPKPRYTMNNSTSKWPEGYKGFVSAINTQIIILNGFINSISPDVSVYLSWYSTKSCGNIIGYKIYYSDGTNNFIIDVGNTLSTTINFLNVNSIYLFYINAISTDGQVYSSNTITIQT